MLFSLWPRSEAATLRSSRDLSACGIEALGSLPSLELPWWQVPRNCRVRIRVGLGRKGRRGREDRLLLAAPAEEAPEGSLSVLSARPPLELLAWRRPGSFWSDCLRGIEANLEPRMRGGDVFLLTSGTSGEGATTAAANLGITLTEGGRSVLLVDGNWASPRLAEVFHATNPWGFSDLGRTGAAASFWTIESMARSTSLPGLFLVPAGSYAADFATAVASIAAARFLLWARRQFDVILIDGPPVAEVSQAKSLRGMVDGLILVAVAGRTSRDGVERSAEMLSVAEVPLAGGIVNGVEPFQVRARREREARRREPRRLAGQPLGAATRRSGRARQLTQAAGL